MKKEKRFRLGLSTMLIVFVIMPLVLSVGIISMISLSIVRSNLKDGVEDTLSIVANNLSSYCKENHITVMNASNYYEYIDSLKDYGIEMAIIMEGVPGTTSIKNENGYRIREINLAKDIVADREELLDGYYDEHVEIDGKIYYAYYIPLLEDGEITALAFAGELQDKVDGAVNSVISGILGVAAVLLAVIIFGTLFFAGSLSKSFAVLSAHVKALSEGNLSRQKGRKSSVREIHSLLGAAGVMQSNLSETIGNVKNVAERLVGNIGKVTELSDSNAKRAQHITSHMDELSASTEVMEENVRDIQAQMMEIGNCVNDISVSVEQLYGNSDQILRTNNEAKNNLDSILENSGKSVRAVNDIASQIRQTNDSITEIDNVVELILNISDQTSLLSLNASIEAARAGESGRGFAVVAEEIRKLSEQSAEGAEMIRNLSKMITDKSQRSVELADRVHALMTLEQESITVTQRKYGELSRNIDQSVNEIRSIAEKTENLTDYKEKVISNVQRLSEISEENAENGREVNANIGSIISEVEMVNDNCEKMSEIARTLEESVAYFHR